MTGEFLLDAVTGATLIGLVLVYLGLLIGTLVCAIRGDITKALTLGVAFLTMMSPGLGFLVLIIGLIVALCTRNVSLAGPIAVGFIVAIVAYFVICTVIGVAVVVGGVLV